MAENLNKLMSKLSKRGPHRVLVGDLEYAGLPGKVYTPADGNGLPAVAFGHDWMTSIKRYHATLRHLASWGIVVAAPETELGVAPDHRGFSADLETALQILAGVKLGSGSATVSPGKLGIVGHGMGGGAAILAAANRPNLSAVAALYPAMTSPSSVEAAKAVSVPGLILGPEEDNLVEAGNPLQVAAAWQGTTIYREIKDGNQSNFPEHTMGRRLIGMGKPNRKAQEIARGLVTGFILHAVGEDKKYSAFTEFDSVAKNVNSYTPTQVQEKLAKRGY